MKELSVIIASQNAGATLEECLSALDAQNQSGLAEIIVVDNSTQPSTQMAVQKFRGAELIQVKEPCLIPELWARGAERAVGRVVALTTAHCVPDTDWISEILRHHQSPCAGMGGAIENRRPASITQWAVYFCRYAAYMLPFPAHTVKQIPGDNASYKRWVLKKFADLRGGLWEFVINDALGKDGHRLLLSPKIRVNHSASPGTWAFCRQRIIHGRIFGEQRAVAVSFPKRLEYVAIAPLVPLVYLLRIIGQVWRKHRNRWPLFLSLPLVMLFVICWAVGEFLGYIGAMFQATGATGGGVRAGSVEVR